ncbi:hypothetical protein ABK040_013453 [Willaertia magna]
MEDNNAEDIAPTRDVDSPTIFVKNNNNITPIRKSYSYREGPLLPIRYNSSISLPNHTHHQRNNSDTVGLPKNPSVSSQSLHSETESGKPLLNKQKSILKTSENYESSSTKDQKKNVDFHNQVLVTETDTFYSGKSNSGIFSFSFWRRNIYTHITTFVTFTILCIFLICVLIAGSILDLKCDKIYVRYIIISDVICCFCFALFIAVYASIRFYNKYKKHKEKQSYLQNTDNIAYTPYSHPLLLPQTKNSEVPPKPIRKKNSEEELNYIDDSKKETVTDFRRRFKHQNSISLAKSKKHHNTVSIEEDNQPVKELVLLEPKLKLKKNAIIDIDTASQYTNNNPLVASVTSSVSTTSPRLEEGLLNTGNNSLTDNQLHIRLEPIKDEDSNYISSGISIKHVLIVLLWTALHFWGFVSIASVIDFGTCLKDAPIYYIANVIFLACCSLFSIIQVLVVIVAFVRTLER